MHAHALADSGDELSRGQTVDLVDHDGNWVARGIVNPASKLRVRLYAFDQSIQINEDLWRNRINESIARRRLHEPFDAQSAERLVFSESDLISGLIVDRYADCLGVQLTSGGLTKWQDVILEQLSAATGATAMMVRTDEKTAKHEGIDIQSRWVGEAPAGAIAYRLNGLDLVVDLHAGQKTGGYLDQRDNHKAAASYLVGKNVLDVCCYNGGFGLVASKAGAASVLGIDSSQAALDAAQRAADQNQLRNVQFQRDDCFDALEKFGEQGKQFDAVILDPPRFAGSRHQIDSALRAYRRLNSLALDLIPPGGILVTCSCSGRVTRADFTKMLLDVGRRKRRDLVVFENRGPSADHPVAIGCPESSYLKCVIAQVM